MDRKKDSVDTRKKRGAGVSGGLWKVMAIVFPLGLSGAIVGWLAVEILVTTGPWGTPLIFAYMAVLLAIGAYIPIRRDRNEYHFRVGDELFYVAYSKEMKKALQKAEKKGIAPETEQVLEKYRRFAEPVVEQETVEAAKRRERNLRLYYFTGLIMLVPAVYLVYRAFPALQNLLPLSMKSDFTGVFSLLGALHLLLNAILIFRRKEIPQLAGSTVIVLLLNTWACFVTFSVAKKYTVVDILLCLGCCVVFVLAKYLLPRLLGDLRSPEEKSASRREFELALYKLGVIDEKELDYRLTKK